MSRGVGGHFRVGFVAGVTPDRWARVWADRMPRRALDLVPLPNADGSAPLRAGALHMCFVRLPVDREGLHVIPLYDEQPAVAAYDEVDVAELADEHLLQDPEAVPAWCEVATEVAENSRCPVPELTLRQAVESVAADAGILVLPMSVARLHHRRGVAHVPVTGVPATTVALAWPVDADDGDDRYEAFIGVVRGRTASSSRGGGRPPPKGSRGRRR
jgi:hypothetical protein